MIHGSDEVLAMFGGMGIFYRGKWENIKVNKIGDDEDTPLEVREALVGLTIPTIFRKDRIEEQTGADFGIPEGSRLAYGRDVIEVLKSAGKEKEAAALKKIVPDTLDIYVFEGGIYDSV